MNLLSSHLALLLVCLLAQTASFCPLSAQDAAEDPDLPKPFDATQLDPLIANPPFTRSVNPSDSLVLSGLAFIDGKPVATLFDSATKTSFIVSDQPNAKGWTLSEALATQDIRTAQAKISIGGEIVSIRYNKDALVPDKLKKERSGENRGPPPPGPQGSNQGYQRSGPRPSQEDIERYKSLSDKSREKLREEFTKNRERLMNATPEERSAFMKSTFERIAKEDSGGGGGGGGGGKRDGGDRNRGPR
jgi:hypothetical protein